ncbi:MAG: hypothetical protein MJE68_28510 [Proteobacteria bacterium]|nr:hypothetical protein [Pseudomonadota bacterium]
MRTGAHGFFTPEASLYRISEVLGRAQFILIIYFFSGTVEDTELVEGLVLDQKASHLAGGVTRVEKAKVGLIQFCISPPKTDVRILL